MTLPSKKEFQDLIDYCNQDRFTFSILDLNNKKICEFKGEYHNQFEDMVYGEYPFSATKISSQVFLSDLKKYPAHQWLTSLENKQYFDTLIELIYTRFSINTKNIIHTPLSYEKEFTTHEKHVLRVAIDLIVKSETAKDDSYCVIVVKPSHAPFVIKKPDRHYLIKEKNLQYIVIFLQYREKMLAHFLECLKDYRYPPITIEPNLINKDLKELIKNLKATSKKLSTLEKRNNGCSFTISPNASLQLQELRQYFECIDKKELFHKKRATAQYKERLFISSICKVFITYYKGEFINDVSYYDKKSLSNIMMQLLNINCFSVSMNKKNVNSAIEETMNLLLDDNRYAYAFGLVTLNWNNHKYLNKTSPLRSKKSGS